MNNQRGARPGDFNRLQFLERKLRIRLAQDFHLPLEGCGNHRQIGPVLEQCQQSEIRCVGDDLDVVAGLSFNGASKGLSEPGGKCGRSLQDQIVRTGCANAG